MSDLGIVNVAFVGLETGCFVLGNWFHKKRKGKEVLNG